MKKSICITVVVFALAAGVFAQLPKYKYEITKFGAPYSNATGDARETVLVAADGKGSILVLRRSNPPVLVYNSERGVHRYPDYRWGLPSQPESAAVLN